MPKPASTRPAYKMLTCIYLCRTLLFFAPYADFYVINISKITSIGYPDDEDVTVDPTDPINQKTYMQAHITVEPWTKVEQDAELGM